jgi:hypothetical protein
MVVIADRNQQKPVDWRPTYSVREKTPLGLFVLNNEIQSLLDAEVIRFNETPYEYLNATYNYDTAVSNYTIGGTVLHISQGNTLDEESAKELFYFASHGNNVFLSMKSFPEVILDSLQIETNNHFNLRDSIQLTLANPEFAKQPYYLAEDAATAYFSKIDTLETTILGYQEADSIRVNFIKVAYKSGNFYLHTQPAAFTNFHLLKGNHHQYAEKVMSYIPGRHVYWYTKSPFDLLSDSPLRYVFSQKALSWAWYLFILGMLVFIVFNAKRKQRIVPIIRPLQNTTVEFAKTIGNLYYQEGDYNTMIDKKIIYFLERIRSEYLIDTTKLDDDFIRKLHQKSGKDMAAIERAVHLINLHQKSYHHGVESDLIQINNAIEQITH